MLMTAGHRLIVVSLIILLLLDGLLIGLIDSSCLHRLLKRLPLLILIGTLLVWLLLLLKLEYTRIQDLSWLVLLLELLLANAQLLVHLIAGIVQIDLLLTLQIRLVDCLLVLAGVSSCSSRWNLLRSLVWIALLQLA